MELEEDHNIKLIDSLIINTLNWQPLTNFESRNSRKAADNKVKYGGSGVYLITTKEKLS